MKTGIFKYTTGLILLPAAGMAQEIQKHPNVLFIAVDDLRPELNCYGMEYMHTPNIDRLAGKGTLFTRAYCQQAVSAASRNSLLTGLRPDAIGIYDLNTFFRTSVPDVVTLPQYFKQNGYRTECVGKIFHDAGSNRDDARSWSVPKWNLNKIFGAAEPVSKGDTVNIERDAPRVGGKRLAYFISDQPEETMTDTRHATLAIDRLKELKDNPFFLAVGFLKPHLPHVAPRKYWDMYNRSDIAVPERSEPQDMPKYSLDNFSYLRGYADMPAQGPIDDFQTQMLTHAYRACVSYIDAQIGRLLEALEENGLSDNTIVVLWGDHGYKLGEYGHWCKQSNNEIDTNVPLIVSVPGAKGQKSNSLVEFVDLYPTLCDLAGLKQPEHLQGISLVPVLNNPKVKIKDVAISQFPRGKKNEIMGYSIRTEQYRYTRWVSFNKPDRPTIAVELYDQSRGVLPKTNLAGSAKHKKTVEELDRKLTEELAKYPNVIDDRH